MYVCCSFSRPGGCIHPVLRGHQLMFATDNTTVVAYINKQGGTYSLTLLHLVVDLFLWLQPQDIAIWARHIPSCPNVIADHLSWPNQPITTEWSLHPEIVTRIIGTWETPTVDMFATVHNMHLPQFWSPIPVPRALAIDAVTRLAGEVDVHVSTVPPSQQSHSETQDHPGLRSDTNSPLVAATTVVFTSTTSVCGPPSLLSVPPGLKPGVCLGQQVIPYGCWEALTQHY